MEYFKDYEFNRRYQNITDLASAKFAYLRLLELQGLTISEVQPFRKTYTELKNKYPKIYEQIEVAYTITEKETENAKFYFFLNGITELPKCAHEPCQNKAKFNKYLYMYCCNGCRIGEIRANSEYKPRSKTKKDKDDRHQDLHTPLLTYPVYLPIFTYGKGTPDIK